MIMKNKKNKKKNKKIRKIYVQAFGCEFTVVVGRILMIVRVGRFTYC